MNTFPFSSISLIIFSIVLFISDLTVTQLLQDFFDFYCDFDYGKHTICCITGTEQSKDQRKMSFRNSDRIAIDIVNPIESWLNCAGNITVEAILRFKRSCMQTLQKFPEVSLPNRIQT